MRRTEQALNLPTTALVHVRCEAFLSEQMFWFLR